METEKFLNNLGYELTQQQRDLIAAVKEKVAKGEQLIIAFPSNCRKTMVNKLVLENRKEDENTPNDRR